MKKNWKAEKHIARSVTHYHIRAVTEEQVTFSEALVFLSLFRSSIFLQGTGTKYSGGPHVEGTLQGYKHINGPRAGF